MTTANHALNLRLLGHPFTGHPDLLEQERTQLFAAADEIDRLNKIVLVLGQALADFPE